MLRTYLKGVKAEILPFGQGVLRLSLDKETADVEGSAAFFGNLMKEANMNLTNEVKSECVPVTQGKTADTTEKYWYCEYSLCDYIPLVKGK